MRNNFEYWLRKVGYSKKEASEINVNFLREVSKGNTVGHTSILKAQSARNAGRWLDCGLCWSNTPQGYAYWYEVTRKLKTVVQ